MSRSKKKDELTESFFEEDYLVRTLGRIAHDPEVALTELVANAWDAGASLVDITVPGVRETALVVQDDGHGMSMIQFKGRWMRLGYDRIKHQGVQVEFPPERSMWRRKAYVRQYAQQVFGKLSSDLVEESSEEALVRNREDFKGLSQLGRIEVASFARDLVKANPTVHPDTLSAAVQALINLEKSRGGAGLLEKLTKLDESDIDGLDRLLSQWTVRDALSVLDEIDHRLAVVTAIEKLCGDPATDELHTLHPLVTQARWLFGPEFDSSEYASNVSLRTATAKVFGRKVATEAFANARQRPDIMVLSDATCSVVGTETFDSVNSNLMRIQDVLIIELKKGKSAIGRDEMNQADGYIQDFLGSGALDGTPTFRAFVVGYEIAAKTSREKEIKEEGVLRGKVMATTYGQLTRTAHQRLFRLKERIPAKYEDVSGADLSARVMQTATQAPLSLVTAPAPDKA